MVRYGHLLSERHGALGITSLNVEQIGEVHKPPVRSGWRAGGLFCPQHPETTQAARMTEPTLCARTQPQLASLSYLLLALRVGMNQVHGDVQLEGYHAGLIWVESRGSIELSWANKHGSRLGVSAVF